MNSCLTSQGERGEGGGGVWRYSQHAVMTSKKKIGTASLNITGSSESPFQLLRQVKSHILRYGDEEHA